MVNVNYGKEQKTKKQTNKQKKNSKNKKKLCISYNCTIIHTHSHISQTRVVTNKLWYHYLPLSFELSDK